MKKFQNILNYTKFMRSAVLGILSFCAFLSVPAKATNDLRYAYPDQMSVSPLGVNLQNGRFTYSKTDIQIGPLQLIRSWAGSMPVGNVMGTYQETPSYVYGWTHNHVQGVEFVGESDKQYDVFVDGKRYRYALTSSFVFMPWNKAALGTLLTQTTSTYSLTDQSGNKFTFNKSLPSSAIVSAEYADGSRLDYSYNSSHKLVSILSSRGYALNFEYDSYNNVKTVCGFNTGQNYTTSSTSCTGAALKVVYTYSAGGAQLASVTDVAGGVTQMTGYVSYAGPTCITKVNSSSCAIQNFYGTQPGETIQSPPDVVRKQIAADGKIWLYRYRLGEDPSDVPIVPGRPRWTHSWMTAPNGDVTSLKYDRGVLVSINAPSGNTKYHYENEAIQVGFITFDYHAVQPVLVTHDEGNREYFQYDGRGQVVIKSSWPKDAPYPEIQGGGDMISRTDADLAECCTTPGYANIPAGSATYIQLFPSDYPANGTPKPTGCGAGPADAKICNKPGAQSDARGNITQYTYDKAHGGVLTETGPADASGVRPQTRYSYVQRKAWTKNSAGTYVQSSYPAWVLASKSMCKTSAATGNVASPCAAGAADEVRTTYDYGPDSGPNNLLLRGVVDDATGLRLRTCYSYDWRGNKISETKPKAGLTSCP